MARQGNGTTDRIDYTNPGTIGGGTPCTIAMWIKPDTLDSREYFFSARDSGGDLTMLFEHFGSNQMQFATAQSGGIMTGSFSDVALTTGTWQHILVTWNSVNSSGIAIYRNGTNVTGGGVTDNGVGPASNGTFSLFGRISDDARNFDGGMAWVGVWNRVLAAHEITALANRFHPRCFRRGLIFGPELIRNPYDPISGQAGTLDGTTVVDSPPIIFPNSSRSFGVPAAAPPATGNRRRRFFMSA